MESKLLIEKMKDLHFFGMCRAFETTLETGRNQNYTQDEMINYLLDAEVGRDLAEFIYYATPNAAAKALCSEEYTSNPAIFPPAAAVASSEVAVFPGQEAVERIDAAWTRVKAAG